MQAFSLLHFNVVQPWLFQIPTPPPKKKYLFNRFCIALAFPFLAHADVLALMEPFILLNGEKVFCTHQLSCN